MRAILDEMRIPVGRQPGLINPATRAHAAMVSACSPAYPQDPLLRMYDPEPFESWKPHMRRGDFFRIYYSDWDTVNEETRAEYGHGNHDLRFYAVLRWRLPQEMVDQLAQLVRLNPDSESADRLARRTEFERAVEISEGAREAIVNRILKMATLERKKDVGLGGGFVHTTSDVFVPGVSSDYGEDMVAFYSACAPSNLTSGGVLSVSDEPSAPAYIFFGPPDRTNVGGDPWDMPEVANAVPTNLVWSKADVMSMAGVGLPVHNGFIKLQPIV